MLCPGEGYVTRSDVLEGGGTIPCLNPSLSRNSFESNFQLKDVSFLKTFCLKQLVSGHNSALDFFLKIPVLK